MALTTTQHRNYSVVGVENSLSIQATTEIFSGGALSIDTGGEVGPLSTAEVNFAGFALQDVDNTSGAAADKTVRVMRNGEIELTIVGLDDNNDIGDLVAASDDDTFTLTTSGSKAFGRISEITNVSSNKAKVAFQSFVDQHPLN